MLFNPKLQETSGSSVTQQTAVSQPNIVGGIADAVSQVSSIFTKVNKAEEEGASAGFMSSYTQELTRIAARVQQDPSFTANNGSSEAQRAYTKALTHPLAKGNAKAMGDVYNQINGITGSFKTFETLEQQIYKKVVDRAAANGELNGSETPEQVKQVVMELTKREQLQNDLKEAKLEEELYKSKSDRINAGRKTELETKTKNLTVEYLKVATKPTLKRVEFIYGEVKAGRLLPSDGSRLIEVEKAKLQDEAYSIGSEDFTHTDSLLKSTMAQADNLVELMNEKIDLDTFENRNNKNLATTTAVMLSDIAMLEFAAVNKLLGNSVGALQFVTKKSMEAVKSLSSRAEDPNPTPLGNPFALEGMPDFYQVQKNASLVASKKIPDEDTEELKVEVATVNNNLNKAIVDNSRDIKTPEDVSSYVFHVSSPEYSEFVKRGEQNPEQASEAQDMLKRFYGDDLMAAVSKNLNTTFETIVGAIPFLEDRAESVKDLVDIEYNGNGIVFKAKSGVAIENSQMRDYTKMVRTLNDTVGVKLNTYNKAKSNLLGITEYGESAKTTFEAEVLPYIGKSVDNKEKFAPDGFAKGVSMERFFDKVGLTSLLNLRESISDPVVEAQINAVKTVWKALSEGVAQQAEVSKKTSAAEGLPLESIAGAITSPFKYQEEESLPNTPTESLRTPNKGDVMEGWRFMGGEPSDKNNWEEIL